MDVTDVAEKTDTAAEVLGLTVEVESVLDHVLSFEVLGPPFVESWVFEALDEGLETVNHFEFGQHARDLGLVSA